MATAVSLLLKEREHLPYGSVIYYPVGATLVVKILDSMCVA